MTVTARINVETAAGRKIVRELEKHPKVVEIENPLLALKTVSANEAYERGLNKLSEHYGLDMQELKSKLK